MGLLLGSALGITRTMYADPDNKADFMPVDVCAKAMIISAWKRMNEPRYDVALIHDDNFVLIDSKLIVGN